MSDDPVRPAASTPEALHAIIADAFSRGDVGAFLAAHEEGASVVVPPDGTRTRQSGTGTIVSRRGPDGTWRIVFDDPQSGAAAAAARVIYGRT